jgi:hypothetical protein
MSWRWQQNTAGKVITKVVEWLCCIWPGPRALEFRLATCTISPELCKIWLASDLLEHNYCVNRGTSCAVKIQIAIMTVNHLHN